MELGGELLPYVAGVDITSRLARYWVHDNGRGLTLEEQARLFMPFERLGQTNIGGHGLGLSIVKRIVEKGVGEMRRNFASNPRDLVAAIGPGVQGCCYEVGQEVRSKFESQFAYGSTLFREVKDSDPVRERYPLLFLTARAPGHSDLPVKIFLDLVEANRRQLIDAGLAPKNIEASAPCTACHSDLLFSFRADKGVTGRLMGVVGIKVSK